ncbi:hypothetical protein AB4Z50_34995 [Paenibacillus sp. 2TAB26]|uniref:hypothetical protein n=1 Tax=Paenibacillus sp. 2TAB26 TaxID=3233005 RepID=UPI003F9C4A0F
MEGIVYILVLIALIISLRQVYLIFKKDIPRARSKKIICDECGRGFKDVEIVVICPHRNTKYVRHVDGELKKQ